MLSRFSTRVFLTSGCGRTNAVVLILCRLLRHTLSATHLETWTHPGSGSVVFSLLSAPLIVLATSCVEVWCKAVLLGE